MAKRRAESAGKFNIASEILKPRTSHNREPRLSKMHLENKMGFDQEDLSTNLHKVNLYIHYQTFDADDNGTVVGVPFPRITLLQQTDVRGFSGSST